LRQLRAAGVVKPEEVTVVVLTGSGLKATQTVAELMGRQEAAFDPQAASAARNLP